jgi:hypothetical protein
MTTAEGIKASSAAGTREHVRTWSLITLVAFILSLVAYVGFTTVGGIWFTISDALAIGLAGAMMPVMAGLDVLLRPVVGNVSRTARWLGLTGMTIVIIGSIVLLTSEVSHEFVPAGGGLGMQFIGFGLEGVWFLILARIAGRAGLFSGRLVNVTYLVGAGFVVGSVGSPIGPEHPLVMVGMTVAFIGVIAWVVMLRRELASGR